MTEYKNTPQIFVTSYSSRNEGKMFGCWLEIPSTKTELRIDIERIMGEAPHNGEKKTAIIDCKNFAPFKISQDEDLESIITKADIIYSLYDEDVEHPQDYYHQAFILWFPKSLIETPIGKLRGSEILEQFHEQYQGVFTHEDDFVDSHLDEAFHVNERLTRFIHYKQFWEFLKKEGYYSVEENEHYFIFAPHI